MRKTFNSGFWIAFMVVAFVMAGLPPKVAGAEGPTQLNGHWNLNPQQSDNAALKVRQAKQDARVNKYDEFPHLSAPGGTWGSMDGPQGGINPSADIPQADDPVWDRLAKDPKSLSIEQRSDQIVITDESGHSQTFYLDSKLHHDKDAKGKKVTTLAGWVRSIFVAKTQISGTKDISQTFTLSTDGRQLLVTTRLEIQSIDHPLITIRRLYDLQKLPAT